VIALDGVSVKGRTATGARLTVSGVDVEFGAGSWGLLGGEGDGADILLAALAGELRLHRGSVRYFDGSDDAAASAHRIAYVARDGRLPGTLTVAEVLALASRLRREPPQSPEERLHAWGLQSLARRRVDTLSRRERRSVAMAEALTSEARLLLIDEPLCEIDDRLAAAIPDALRRRAEGGDCVVFATGSVRDAMLLTDNAFILRRGQRVARLDLGDPTQLGHLQRPVLHVRTAHARMLLAELALEPAVIAIDTSSPNPHPETGPRPAAAEGPASKADRSQNLTVRGLTLAALAEAVQRAVLRTEVAVDAISSHPPALDELQESAQMLRQTP
jgi:ABC-type multidrug transport system ATPase subunit